jgi:hypothetical protein
MEQDSGSAIVEGIASIYADMGSDEQNTFFVKNFKKTKGMNRFKTMNDYNKFLKRCNDTTVASGIKVFEDIARHGGSFWMKSSGMQFLNNISDLFDERESKAQSKLDDLKKSSKEESLISQKEKEIENYKKLKTDLKDLMDKIKKEETDPKLTKLWDK